MDKRGKRIPTNKTPSDTLSKINTFIRKTPKYMNNYDDNSGLTYLPPDVTYTKLHQKYLEENPNHKAKLCIFKRQCKRLKISVFPKPVKEKKEKKREKPPKPPTLPPPPVAAPHHPPTEQNIQYGMQGHGMQWPAPFFSF